MTGVGDDVAARFDRYVAERGGELWRSAWLLTEDAHHAEDLVQTALLKTYARFGSFDDDRHYEAYVRTTMYRTFVSWWRRRRWRGEVPVGDLPDGPDEDHVTDECEDLRRAMLLLPRAQRAVLVLRFVEDLPVSDVARLLRLPVSTVKSHTRRGLAALRVSPELSEQEGQS